MSLRAFLPWLLAPTLLACRGAATSAGSPIYSPPTTRADAHAPSVQPVYLRLVAPDRSALERATDDQWAYVCSSPCDGWVPTLGSYRVVLPDQRVSSPFSLPAPPGTWLTLAVDGDGRVWTRDSVYLASRRHHPVMWSLVPLWSPLGRLR